MSISELQLDEMLARMARNKAVRNGGPEPEPQPGEPETREDDLHQKILDDCATRGWIALHGSMAHRTKRTIGEPDFIVVADRGRVFFIEAKSKDGKVKREQAALLAWAKRLGHRGAVIRSLAEFLEFVDQRQP